MKKIVASLTILTLIILVSSCVEKRMPSELLFQENADNWFSQGDAEWRFVNDELIGSLDSGSSFVMTKRSYSDFVLELEFKPDSAINSGIFIRCKNKELSHTDCYEINIWDLHPNQDYRTGAVVTRAKPLKKIETIDKWNTYKIKNDKDHLQVWINDVKTIDIEDKDLTDGPIALQAAESGKISFLNIRITTLN